MSGRTLVQIENPTTQRTDALEALAAYLNKPIEGGVLDLGSLKLVKSNKRDAFYGVTANKCSCPSASYRPGAACKHQRKHFPGARATIKLVATGSLIKRGGFRPFDEMSGEERARTTPSMLIDCHDSTAMDAAYWSIREDREMWPLCEA